MRTSVRNPWVLAVLGGAAFIFFTGRTQASFINNFNGTATATVAAWGQKNPNTNPPDYYLSFTGPAPSAFLGPNLPKCKPPTFVKVAGVANQGFTWSAYAAPGDTVAYDGLDLEPYITPTVDPASVSGSISFNVSGGMVQVSGTLTESGEGAAIRLEWFDITDPSHPIHLTADDLLMVDPTQSPITEPLSENIVEPAGGLNDLLLQFDALAQSLPVPEPSSLVLLSLGTVGLLGWGWQRRKAVRR